MIAHAVSLEPGDIDSRIVVAWSQDAAMEHASIGSFARFTLELLAVGAPAKLLVASQDAGRDEVHHAQKCFAIASRFAGAKLGPGPLDVSGVDAQRDLASMVIATVDEGCLNETLSALVARERAEGTADRTLRSALAKIAEDEARHAELAWQFVSWAIGKGGDAVRKAALAAFGAAKHRSFLPFNPVLRGLPTELVRACGLLDEDTARAVGRRAVVEVIGPRAAAVVGAVCM